MPGYDTLLCIAQYFGVSVDYLLGNEVNAAKSPLESEFCDNVNYHTFMSCCNKLSLNKKQAVLAMVNALLEDS